MFGRRKEKPKDKGKPTPVAPRRLFSDAEADAVEALYRLTASRSNNGIIIIMLSAL